MQAQVKPSTAAERSNGLQKRKLLEKDTTLNSIKFRNAGPGIMSGRVEDVDVNPADPTEFYVAYATGGLWYTKNNGQSLVPVFDKENAFGIGDIAVNWSDGIIWIGTGEANSSRSSPDFINRTPKITQIALESFFARQFYPKASILSL